MKNRIRSFCFLLLLCAMASSARAQQVKNIIFMIGDGMGLAHVSAALVDRDYAPLAMERAQYIGLCKTYSSNNKVTDSAAAGTALATGVKTYNSAIGVGPDKQPLKTTLEKASENGFATGLVVTCYLAQATPAAFAAHQASRSSLFEIAADLIHANVDVMIGGGMLHFTNPEEGVDLIGELKAKHYTIAETMEQVMVFDRGKLAAILAPSDLPSVLEGRGDYLPRATGKALEILAKNSPKGFFVMIEGSQIDHLSHANNAAGAIAETIDFDNAVRIAFDFADRNPGTLVVVTADHETGGLTIPAEKNEKGVDYKFSTGGHTGILVPVYAYGTGAENFKGVYENTDLPKIMQRLMGLK